MTLFVNTAGGVMVRRIPSASPLRPSIDHGHAAEDATHEASAVWGLPDFTYRPAIQAVGSGVRELGDGFIIVGPRGIVLQVKSREKPSADPEKERRWLTSAISKALSQGVGTIRTLKRHPVELTNLRERTIEIDGNDHHWLVVVIIDHPNPPDGFEPDLAGADSAVVLLRRDWEFLFDQLKSTYAVVQYCERVAGESVELGTAPHRYYDLALADANAAPKPLDPAVLGPGQAVSMPLFPLAPVASEDRDAHLVVRAVFEDIARTKLSAADEADAANESDRLRVLGELDRLPVGYRGDLGHYLLDEMVQVLKEVSPEGSAWRMRSLKGRAGDIHLGFGACSRPYSNEIKELLSLWVRLRHHDALVARKDVDHLTTVGVLLTPRNDKIRRWDTTMLAMSGDPELLAEEIEELRELWPIEDADKIGARAA